MSRDWTNITITNIMNEKLVADFEDHCDKRKYTTLKKFLIEYFFKHFGCRKLAVGSLKDFVFS